MDKEKKNVMAAAGFISPRDGLERVARASRQRRARHARVRLKLELTKRPTRQRRERASAGRTAQRQTDGARMAATGGVRERREKERLTRGPVLSAYAG
jgi:hypothetical protein